MFVGICQLQPYGIANDKRGSSSVTEYLNKRTTLILVFLLVRFIGRTYVQCLTYLSSYRRVQVLLQTIWHLVVETYPTPCSAHDPVSNTAPNCQPPKFTLGRITMMLMRQQINVHTCIAKKGALRKGPFPHTVILATAGCS